MGQHRTSVLLVELILEGQAMPAAATVVTPTRFAQGLTYRVYSQSVMVDWCRSLSGPTAGLNKALETASAASSEAIPVRALIAGIIDCLRRCKTMNPSLALDTRAQVNT
jgi:hypothetical protein